MRPHVCRSEGPHKAWPSYANLKYLYHCEPVWAVLFCPSASLLPGALYLLPSRQRLLKALCTHLVLSTEKWYHLQPGTLHRRDHTALIQTVK